MNDSAETKIIKLHPRLYTQDEITITLHTNKTRVSQSIRHFRETDHIPDALRGGRPSRVTGELASDIEPRTIQGPSVSGEALSGEISDEFGVSLL
jgi:transposase